MTGDERSSEVRFDGGPMLHFFAWLFGMFVCTAGFLAVALGTPWGEQFVGDHPWLIAVVAGAGFVAFAVAATPFYLGIRCRGCGRRLRRAPAQADLTTGNAPLMFHCPACNVTWRTGLVSGPGSTSPHWP